MKLREPAGKDATREEQFNRILAGCLPIPQCSANVLAHNIQTRKGWHMIRVPQKTDGKF